MQFNWHTLVPAIALCCSLPAWSAREFTPQAGLWMIPAENNGQPGRGFSLDVQGNTAFLQVFNYEKSGAATFHTAAGQLDDSASMTVPLLRFKGGRSFGGPAQDAVEDGNAGQVTVKFTDGLNGTIQFPGETIQPIARFLINEKLPFWWTQISDSPPSGTNGGRGMMLFASGADGARYSWGAWLSKDAEDLPYRLTFDRTRSSRTANVNEAPSPLDCTLEPSTQVFDCIPAKTTDPSADASANALQIHRLRLRFLGRDVVGEIQPEVDQSSRLVLNGTTFSSSSQRTIKGLLERSSRTYSVLSLLPEDCIMSCVTMGDTHVTLLPTSGAWVIEAEKNGNPGRGIFLDVQDETIVVQTSDYLATGESTFHMGAGLLNGSNTLHGDTTTAMSLQRYAGGRHFGGPAQTGHEAANAGELKLSFSPMIGKEYTDFAVGEVTLPGESAQRIRRLQFEPDSLGMENMLGEYLVEWDTWEGILGKEERWVRLTRVEGQYAKNDDGTVQCARSPFGVAEQYRMLCVWNLEPDAKFDLMKWWRRGEVTIHPFNREKDLVPYTPRTRDRHGNWLGLGAVNLPGLAIPAN
ncbi:hypothetical protein SDC9_51766 [bioreactor metagenome]|uniref:Uncharacterized protein n=1 Tax=bioreactor metagenome TaxID=1076179 RepID=A0A644WNG7_9ZZZZ